MHTTTMAPADRPTGRTDLNAPDHGARDRAVSRRQAAKIAGIAYVGLFLALDQVSGAEELTAFDPALLDAQAMSYLDAFTTTWVIGLLLFGVHLVLLGSMVLTSGTISRALGYLLVLAGAGYVIDTLAHALLGNYQEYEMLFLLIVAVPAVIGELAFTLWLLFRAGGESVVAEVTA